MPELPDVELLRRYLRRTALHRTIAFVEVRDRRLLADGSPRRFARAVAGRRLEATDRHGKHLFVRLGSGGWIALHFGMTGGLRFRSAAHAPPPPTVRLVFRFREGGALEYRSVRRLGRIRLVSTPERFVARLGLGPDALRVDAETFRARLAGRRGALKPVLMNQRVVAGLGNLYTDETCFRARIHPAARLCRLSAPELETLHAAMQGVLRMAIACRVDVRRFPRHTLLPHRRPAGRCPLCGGAWERSSLGGRTTYACRRCQSRR